MKLLVAGAVLATLVASPAMAQSYDPSIGSGNIVPYVNHRNNTVDPAGGTDRAQFRPPSTAYGAVTPFGSQPGHVGPYNRVRVRSRR